MVTAGSTLYPRDLILGYVADAGFDESGVAKYALLTLRRILKIWSRCLF